MARLDESKWKARLQAIGVRKIPRQLTEEVLEKVRTHPQGDRYVLADGQVPGLVLQVGATGAATFFLHYRTKKDERRFQKIATADATTLDDARANAMAILAKVHHGEDPAAEERQAQAEAAAKKSVRAYLEQVYGPKVLAHRKDGGAPRARKPGEEPTASGTWARILSAWEPIADVELGAVTRDRIEKVLADRKESGLEAGTLIRDWGALRALLADAVDRGQLAGVPMGKRPEPIRKLRGNQRVRYLGQRDTDEERAAGLDGEEARFLKALEAFESDELGGGDFLRCAAGLARATGMRRGEIVRLTEKMINMRERRIVLPAAVTKGNKERTVYLSDAAIAALKSWKLRGKGGELFPGEGRPDDVAERWEDRISGARREWPRLRAQARLEDFHFHDLRHDYAVRLLRSCGSLAKVRDAMGHGSVSQTEKYAHVAETEVREAVLSMRA